jgi:sigma-B regulation protein RsbU (phosphoserine phosphatase)
MYQILIVEDDRRVRKLLSKTLEQQGYAAIEAETGEMALLYLEQHCPALVICDLHLPGIDGLSLCRRVKAEPTHTSTYFILLTGDPSEDCEVRALDGGADDFLSKPVHLAELGARVRAGLRLHQALQQQQQLARQLQTQQQVLEAELAEAADYIRTLLPKPMAQPLTIESKFLPSRHLGGDCFDYYWLDADYLAIYLLDVSGHGLRSALVSMAVHNLLQSHALPKVNFYRPDHVLTALNETFQLTPEHDRYFTIWYGVYNRQKRDLFYSSAGHPPAVLLSGNGVQQLKTRGTPIGMFPDVKYTHQRCKVDPQSLLYVFSDGIYEVMDHAGTLWTFDQFVQLLAQQGRATLDAIVERVQQLTGDVEFEDDCSLLQVRFD